MQQRNFDLIAFDWDGTLFDSTRIITRCIQAAVRDVGGTVPTDEAAAYVIGLGLMQALAHAAPDVPVDKYPALGERYRHHYEAHANDLSLFDGVLPLLEALKARGEKVAGELAGSVVMGCGQFCTNPGLVIGIRSPEFSAFLTAFTAKMAEQQPQTMLNAGTLKSYVKGLQALNAHAGITHLTGANQEGNQARPQLFKADVSLLLGGDELLQEEVFGPTTIVVEVADKAELLAAINGLHGQLTATLITEPGDLAGSEALFALLEQKVGRVLFNGYPTGVEVCDSMVHGGPYPATSDARGTSVGTLAIDRFLRPVCYQNCPDALLPDALKNANPLNIARLVDGVSSKEALS